MRCNHHFVGDRFFGSGWRAGVVAVAMVLAWSEYASAQTQLFWDANAGTAGTGGTGNWLPGGVSPDIWRSGSATGSLQAWAGGSRAVFGGTAGTVTISGGGGLGRITNGVIVQVGGYTIAEADGTRYLQITGTDAINVTATTGATTISSPWGLTAAGTIRNNSSGLLTVSGPLVFGNPVTNGASALTIGSSTGGNGDVLISGSLRPITQSGTTTGVSAVTKAGSGTLTLSGNNTYTGGTQINGGVLALGNAGALGTTGTISFGGGTLQFSGSNTTDYSARFSTASSQQYRFDTNGQNVSLATALTSGNGTLEKFGAGQLTLSGTSTFSGTTTVHAGRLAVNGVLGAGDVVVLEAAELGGTGSIGGAVAVRPGAALSPGNSIGALRQGATTFDAGAIFKYEVDSTNLNALGTAADLLRVNGDLAITQGSILQFVDLAGPQSQPFVDNETVFAMINYTGNRSGGFFTYNSQELFNGSRFFVGGQEWKIIYDYTYDTVNPTTIQPLNFQGDYLPADGTQKFVAFIAVPEPSTYVMALAGLACVGYSMRRRSTRV